MSLICPNKSLDSWKELVDRIGEEKAYIEFYKSGLEIPISPRYYGNNPQSSKEINDRLEPFFKKIGVTLKDVTEIKDTDGNKIDAIAASNILHKSLEVISGLAKVDTLPEEASHFFVSILKGNNSPLYKSMLDEITNYDVFKEVSEEYADIYKGNLDKIKDEAIGKLIGQQIVSKFDQPNVNERAGRWWNRVLRFLKEKLGLIDKSELEYTIIRNDPFSKAADYILGSPARLEGEFSFVGEPTNPNVTDEDREVFYQLKNSKQLEERIKTKYNLIEGKEGYLSIIEDGKTRSIKNLIQDKIDKKLENNSYLVTKSKERLEQLKVLGGKGHQDFSDIIERAIAERDGKVAPDKVVNTNDAVYNTLQEYSKNLISSLPADFRVLTNVPIYDKKSDSGTKVDMMVIHADNKVDIYDWKFVDYGKFKNPNSFKETLYNTKLGDIKNYLHNNYGVTNFGKLRSIPIDAQFSKNGLENIKIGSLDIKNVQKDEAYLLPIPLDEEMTGDEKLDRLIQGLLKKKEDLEKSKAPADSSNQQRGIFNEKKFADIQRVGQAIRDIQLKQDLKRYVDIGLQTISDLSTTPINQYSVYQMNNLMDTMKFYGKEMLGLLKDKISEFTNIEKSDFNRLITEAQMWEADLKSEIGKRLLATGSEDLFDVQKETGYWNRMIKSVDKQSHPIIKEFWNKLVLPAKQKTRESVNKVNEEIHSLVKDLQKIIPGKSTGDLFSWLIDEGKNKKLEITAKYKQEFYDKLNEARSKIKDGEGRNDAIKFLQEQGDFDLDSYTRDFNARVDTLNYIYRNDVDKDEKISDRIKRFRKDNDNEIGLSNPYNPYFKLKENSQLYSEKYSRINSTPEMKSFYDYFIEKTEMFENFIGQRELGGRYLWNVRNDLIDSIKENGLGAFTNMSSIIDHLEARSSDTLGMVNPNTGLPTYDIPAYYTQPSMKEVNGEWIHDSKNQSKDLGKVLSLVAAMAYNHKYMSEIEADSKALGTILQTQESIQTDSRGNPIRNKLTGEIQKIVGSVKTLEQYTDYVNAYIYGIRNKTKDFVIPIGNRNISSVAIIKGLSKWFVGKTLILNPTSVMAHAVRSHLNVRILAGMDRFFNQSQYNRSLMKMSSFDKKSMQMISYFDLMEGNNFKRKAEDLSTGFLSNYMTYDRMFIGHTKTDSNVRNAILLSTMQSHTYDEALGRIVKIGDKDAKPLIEQINTDGKTLDLGFIPKEQLELFRRKVLKIGDTALGNNSTDAIRAINLTLMGRALTTFRNWIPNMVEARYDNLRYDEDLQAWELGRYRTFWNNVVSKQFLPIIADGLKRYFTFGYGGKFGDAVLQNAKKLYEEHMEKNPNSKMIEQEYIDLHLANMRGNLVEAYVITALLAGAMAIAPDKDKHEHLEAGSQRKWWSYVLNRGVQDISFFYSPKEFEKQIKSPVPMIDTYLSLWNFGRAYLHKGESIISGQPVKGAKVHEFRKANFDMIPGLAGFESLLHYMQDDYDDTEGSKHKTN